MNSPSPRRILVLAPMTVELAPAAKALGLRRGDDGIHRGRLEGPEPAELTAVLAGVGTEASAAVTREQIEAFAPDHVVVVGVAGGVGDDVAVGDLLVPEVVVDLDVGGEYRAAQLGPVVPAGRLITSGRLILDHDVLRGHARAGVDAVDMETAAIAAVCTERGIPWTAFRGISDHFADGLLDGSTMGLLKPDGSPDLGKVARYVARNPTRMATLAKLGRGSRAATQVASRAVRDALAS